MAPSSSDPTGTGPASDGPSMTRLIHPRVPAVDGVPVSTPIYQTSTYELPRDERAAAIAASVAPAAYYTRYGSPNAKEAEAMLADLDGAEAAVLVASGMAAISATLLANVAAGAHVVAQTTHYTAALTLLGTTLPGLGVEVTLVDQADPAAFAAALRPTTRVVYVETPSNPALVLTDLTAVAAAVRSAASPAPKALLVADNTFATPYNSRPLDRGFDLVVQSATKYLNGHSDVTAGVVTGGADAVARVWETARVLGPVCHPFEAWLLARGLRTFPLRMRRHNASAQRVAEFLAGHPAVAAVHYPGLATHPQHDLARRQMRGFGGVLSFEVGARGVGAARHPAAVAADVLAHTRLARNAVSLGGIETLITHPGSLVFAHQSAEELAASGIAPGLVRLSVGLEEPEDIIADLENALSHAG